MKRILLYLVGIIALVIVGFLSIGFFIPSVEYTTSIEINKPRDFTWKILRERKDWIYGFKSFEQTGGMPDQIGNRAKVTVVRDGIENTFDTQLLDIRPPEMVVTELTNDMMVHQATVRLTESNGKTTVVSDERITGKNLFFRSVFVLFKSRITSVSESNFQGLKRVVESAE